MSYNRLYYLPIISKKKRLVMNKEFIKYEQALALKELGETTLEEAAKDYIENTMKFSFNSLETKTQANRMLKCIEFGAKWQAERMYSGEEVLNIIVDCDGSLTQAKKWFEQFKKK